MDWKSGRREVGGQMLGWVYSGKDEEDGDGVELGVSCESELEGEWV